MLQVELEKAREQLQTVIESANVNDSELEELRTFVAEAKHATGELQAQLDRLVDQNKSEQAAEKIRSTMKPSEMQQWYEQMIELLQSLSGVTLMSTVKDGLLVRISTPVGGHTIDHEASIQFNPRTSIIKEVQFKPTIEDVDGVVNGTIGTSDVAQLLRRVREHVSNTQVTQ